MDEDEPQTALLLTEKEWKALSTICWDYVHAMAEQPLLTIAEGRRVDVAKRILAAT